MELWTGLAALKGDPKCKHFRRFGNGKGAYVNVVAWAESEQHFADRIKNCAATLDCILVELDEIKLLAERMNAEDFPEEFIDMRATANRQPEDIVFGTFHIWMQDEAN